MHEKKGLNGQVAGCREQDGDWDFQDLIEKDTATVSKRRSQTKATASQCMDAIKAGDFVAMETIDEVEDHTGIAYYIAEIQQRTDGKPMKQPATAEQVREWGGMTECALNRQPVKKDSPLFLVRYWIRRPDLHFEESEHGECEVNGEGFRYVVPATEFVAGEGRPSRARPAQRKLAQGAHERIMALL